MRNLDMSLFYRYWPRAAILPPRSRNITIGASMQIYASCRLVVTNELDATYVGSKLATVAVLLTY